MTKYSDSLGTLLGDYWLENHLERRKQIEFDRLGNMSYQEYLQSPEWKEKSQTAKHRTGYRCQLCNRKGNDKTLHTHHKTYERKFHELDSDLIVLCKKCHAKFHDVEKHEDGNDVRSGEIAF